MRNRKVNRGIFKKKVRKSHTRDEIRLLSQASIVEAFENIYIRNRKMSQGGSRAFKMGWGTQIGERQRGYC